MPSECASSTAIGGEKRSTLFEKQMVQAATYLEPDPFFKIDYLLLQVLFAPCRRSLADNCLLRGMEEEAGTRHYLVTDLRESKVQLNQGTAYDQTFTHRAIGER